MKTAHRCIAIALLLVAMSPPAGAQEAERVTLNEALALLVRNNLELRIARADAAEAAGLAYQASAFPNPTLTSSHEPLTGNGRSYSESYFNVGQRFEWPGVRAGRVAAAGHQAESAAYGFSADSSRLAFEMKAVYLRAAHARRAVDVLRRVTEVFREGERRAEVRYAEEDVALYDVRRIQLERVHYEDLLAEADLDAIRAEHALGLLIAPEDARRFTPADDLPTGVPGPVPGNEAIDAAVDRRAELREANALLASRRAAAELARDERMPDVTATGGYKRQSDGLHGAYLGLSFSLPVFDRNSGAIDAAEARTSAAASRLALVRRQIQNDVRLARGAYESLLRRVELRRPAATGGAGDVLAIAEIAYADGELDLVGLLDAAEALRDAELADARLQLGLWIAWYDMERAAGGALNDLEGT